MMPILPTRRQALIGLGGGLSALGLAGCGLQLPGSGDPPRIFTLTPKSTFASDIPSVDWQLLVELPNAPTGINSSRIAVQRTALELDYFARASWTDNMPRMVQVLLIESFENSGRIISVGRQAATLRADYVLKTDIREFQADYAQNALGADGNPTDQPPRIQLRMNFKLVQMPDRRIVASKTFDHVMQASGPELIDIIKGFDDSLGVVLRRVVEWTLKEGQALRGDASAAG